MTSGSVPTPIIKVDGSGNVTVPGDTMQAPSELVELTPLQTDGTIPPPDTHPGAGEMAGAGLLVTATVAVTGLALWLGRRPLNPKKLGQN